MHPTQTPTGTLSLFQLSSELENLKKHIFMVDEIPRFESHVLERAKELANAAARHGREENIKAERALAFDLQFLSKEMQALKIDGVGRRIEVLEKQFMNQKEKQDNFQIELEQQLNIKMEQLMGRRLDGVKKEVAFMKEKIDQSQNLFGRNDIDHQRELQIGLEMKVSQLERTVQSLDTKIKEFEQEKREADNKQRDKERLERELKDKEREKELEIINEREKQKEKDNKRDNERQQQITLLINEKVEQMRFEYEKKIREFEQGMKGQYQQMDNDIQTHNEQIARIQTQLTIQPLINSSLNINKDIFAKENNDQNQRQNGQMSSTAQFITSNHQILSFPSTINTSLQTQYGTSNNKSQPIQQQQQSNSSHQYSPQNESPSTSSSSSTSSQQSNLPSSEDHATLQGIHKHQSSMDKHMDKKQSSHKHKHKKINNIVQSMANINSHSVVPTSKKSNKNNNEEKQKKKSRSISPMIIENNNDYIHQDVFVTNKDEKIKEKKQRNKNSTNEGNKLISNQTIMNNNSILTSSILDPNINIPQTQSSSQSEQNQIQKDDNVIRTKDVYSEQLSFFPPSVRVQRQATPITTLFGQNSNGENMINQQQDVGYGQIQNIQSDIPNYEIKINNQKKENIREREIDNVNMNINMNMNLNEDKQLIDRNNEQNILNNKSYVPNTKINSTFSSIKWDETASKQQENKNFINQDKLSNINQQQQQQQLGEKQNQQYLPYSSSNDPSYIHSTLIEREPLISSLQQQSQMQNQPQKQQNNQYISQSNNQNQNLNQNQNQNQYNQQFQLKYSIQIPQIIQNQRNDDKLNNSKSFIPRKYNVNEQSFQNKYENEIDQNQQYYQKQEKYNINENNYNMGKEIVSNLNQIPQSSSQFNMNQYISGQQQVKGITNKLNNSIITDNMYDNNMAQQQSSEISRVQPKVPYFQTHYLQKKDQLYNEQTPVIQENQNNYQLDQKQNGRYQQYLMKDSIINNPHTQSSTSSQLQSQFIQKRPTSQQELQVERGFNTLSNTGIQPYNSKSTEKLQPIYKSSSQQYSSSSNPSIAPTYKPLAQQIYQQKNNSYTSGKHSIPNIDE